ncbi:MAG: peptide/nickel transport system permease protein [Thermomicrobiales bacterium]|jgi:peptide/nickel transport system permease protein|nr:peptide/nickel transport system permease protein [Thermomicrobiales bacterium]
MNFILRRFALVLPMLLGITVVTFVIINLAPGDPITALINPLEMNVRSADEIARLRDDLGLNDPIPVRYILWLKELATGNLGFSLQHKQPVGSMILDRLPASLGLTATALTLAILIGVTLGVYSALHQYSIFDYVLTILTFFGVSVPVFFMALLGMYIFSVKLRWLPVFGMWTPGEPTTFNFDLIKHGILPVTALAIPQIAGFMRYARAATLDALGADHVTTARAKGLRESAVLWRHVFRTALLPLVTIVGLTLPHIIGGSFIIETIFSWPGVGLLGYTAILQRDYPVQLGIALIAAVAVLLANLATDIVYGIVDPRIRYE